jgi:competence protein ComEC
MAPSDVVFAVALSFLAGVLAASVGFGVAAALGLATAAVLTAVLFRRLPRATQETPQLMAGRESDPKLRNALPQRHNVALGVARGLPWRRAVPFAALAFIAGFVYPGFSANLRVARERMVFDQPTSFLGVIVDEPQTTETFQRFTLRLEPPLHGEVTVVAGLAPTLAYGDLIRATGTIRDPAQPSSFFPKFERTGEHRGSRFKEALIGFKQAALGTFRALLPSDPAALMAGLTFGARGDFTNDFKADMSASGTTHLVALSGYNIAILVLAVGRVFRRWLSRRLTFALTILVIAFFVLMVGAGSSVVRAAVMGLLALLAKEIGRRYDIRNAITVTAALMVLADPRVLGSDAGFGLSFASLLGIVYLEPVLGKLFRVQPRRESFLSWRENGATTCAAQLAVAPLLIRYFGTFSLTAILANVLILAFVPATMFLGFVIAALGTLSLAVGAVVAWAANLLLVYELGVIRLFAHLRLPAEGLAGSWFLVALYYLVLVVLAVRAAAPPAPAVTASHSHGTP